MNKPTTEYFDCGDARIAYKQNGSGPDLLLLHGNSASKEEFTKYQQEYFKDFRTLAIDSRGHGETKSADTAYSFDQYSEDVLALCAGKGITSAYIIGYSDGGNLSLHLAKKAPQLFKKIAAISPNYLAEGLNDKFLSGIQIAEKIFSFLQRAGFSTKRMVMRIQLMTNDIGLTEADLQSITTDIKILHAEKDLIKEEHIQKMAGLIPHCDLQKIMNSNHLSIPYKTETIEAIRQYFID